jgi:hypothetical protein
MPQSCNWLSPSTAVYPNLCATRRSQGTLESTLRPKIEGKSLKQVQQIRSEYHSTKKKKVTPKERAASPVLQAIHEANVATTKKYRYGIKISDLDIPILGPADNP